MFLLLKYFFLYSILCVQSTLSLKTLLINLDKRPDKLEISTYQLKKLGLPFHRIAGIDGFALANTMRNSTLTASQVLGFDFELKLARKKIVNRGNYGQVGCLFSHFKALQYIVKNNITEPVLIFEDDFAADGDAVRKLKRHLAALPKGWGLYYAGHCHPSGTEPCFMVDDYKICTATNLIACAHAFVVNGAHTAELLLKYGNNEESDIADFFAQLAPVKRYIALPFLFSQFRQLKADINSGGGNWFTLKNTTLYNDVKRKFLDKSK